MSAQATVALVFLVRAIEGIDPIARFLAAYERRPAGTPHELVALLKGHSSASLPESYRALLEAYRARAVFTPDVGFDVDAYWSTARALDHERFCFLNSHSEPLVEGWLARLIDALSLPGVGLVGATGSYESHYSQMARSGSLISWRRPLRRVRWAMHMVSHRAHFAPFPNCHLRTTAFAMSARVMRLVRFRPTRSKYDAYRFESGRDGLTAQVKKMGLETLVVGADGTAYPPRLWPESATFRAGKQRNLLVADNHTRMFASADEATRNEMHRAAWVGR